RRGLLRDGMRYPCPVPLHAQDQLLIALGDRVPGLRAPCGLTVAPRLHPANVGVRGELRAFRPALNRPQEGPSRSQEASRAQGNQSRSELHASSLFLTSSTHLCIRNPICSTISSAVPTMIH